jgi:hypothetical protein
MNLAASLSALLVVGLVGCGGCSDYVGVEPKDGFSTEVVVRDHEHSEVPIVSIPSAIRDDRSAPVQQIVFPDGLVAGTTVAFEGELIGPEADTSTVGVSFGRTSESQFPRDGTTVPHSSSHAYRIELLLPDKPGDYVAQVFTKLIPEDFEVGVDDPAALVLETRIIAEGEVTLLPQPE